MNEAQNNSALAKALLFTTALSLLLVASINIVVDPTGEWSTNMFETLVRTSRSTKVELLKGRGKSPPSALILGSSRVMKFEPKEVERHLDAPTFNAGVNSAMVEDYLAMAKYAVEELEYPIHTIVLGVDVESFSNARPVSPRLLSTPELASRLDTSWMSSPKQWLDRLGGTLAVSRLKLSARSVLYNYRGHPEPKSRFHPGDGFLTYIIWERQLHKGTFDITGPLDTSKFNYINRMLGYTKLDTTRQKRFDEFVELCGRRNIRLVVFMTPLHPELDTYLNENSERYPQLKQDVHEYLSGRSAGNKYSYVDTRDITSFGGSSEHYFDGAHPMVENTRLHIKHILSTDVNKNAVQ